jgi:hypothetical protein
VLWELRTIVKVVAEDCWWFVFVRLDAPLVDVVVSFCLRFGRYEFRGELRWMMDEATLPLGSKSSLPSKGQGLREGRAVMRSRISCTNQSGRVGRGFLASSQLPRSLNDRLRFLLICLFLHRLVHRPCRQIDHSIAMKSCPAQYIRQCGSMCPCPLGLPYGCLHGITCSSSATLAIQQHPPAVRADEVFLQNMIPSVSRRILKIPNATTNLRRDKLRVHVGTRSYLALLKVNLERQFEIPHLKSNQIYHQLVKVWGITSTIKCNGTGQSL